MRGRLIVFEGTDGSGKATQAHMMAQRLREEGVLFREIDFPRYGNPFAEPARLYLAGVLGDRPGDVNAYAASTLFAVDRYASYKEDWGKDYENGALILANRYTTSNAVHQCAKLPKQQWDEYLAWLFDFEYEKIAIPAPDMVIYLDVAPEVSQKLMTGRYHGDEAQKDIHEKDVDYLRHSRMAGAYCAEAYGWKRVPCTQGGAMRTRQAIHADVLRLAQAIVTEV